MADKKPKPPKKPSGKSSFVLMVGDEGAILVQMQRKRVVRRLFAQSPAPEHTRSLQAAFLDSPRAPVTILVDMMDQSYVHQTLPPVSRFSVGKIVQRRIDKDFSPDDIKGYLVLGREKTGRKDWNYLMASLANSPVLQEWITFAVERPNPFKGLGLIPLEAVRFLATAEKTLLKSEDKNAKPLEWQILVSHHKVGGFRQIVLKDGKLILTRMAQPIGESLPEVIAGNIEQEMTNTIEYLKRQGLGDPSSLSVIIVASGEIKEKLDPKNIKAGEYHFYTPFEIANLLSITDAAQPEDHFGDVILSAFISRQRSLTLPLNTAYTRKLKTLALAITGVRAVAGLATLGIIAWAGMTGYEVYNTQNDIAELEQKQSSLNAELNKVKAKAKTLPQEINQISDSITLAKLFDKRVDDPLAYISDFEPVLQDVGLVSGLHIDLPDLTQKDADKKEIEVTFTVHLTIPQQPRGVYIAASQALVERVKKAFPNFDVTHTTLPGTLADTQELKTTLGDDNSAISAPVLQGGSQVDEITFTIKGPVKDKNGPRHGN